MIKLRVAILATFSLVAVCASPVVAKDEGIKLNIDDLTCREMLKMESEEHDFALIFMHGFMSGKKSEMVFDGAKLMEATDSVVEHCINNPDEKLLSAFEKFR